MIMRLFGRGASAEDKAAYRSARQELDRVCAESREETDAYYDANDALVEAMEKLPWWQR
jgi:hypothetical protein